jgi:hypothetical protein
MHAGLVEFVRPTWRENPTLLQCMWSLTAAGREALGSDGEGGE